jgi:hypothetical protein
VAKPRSVDRPSKSFFFYGSTGSGKTRTAIEFSKAYAGMDGFVKIGPSSSDGKINWWGHYDGHECVIVDDFRADSVIFNSLLNILDCYYPENVNVKYGLPNFNPHYIFITAPKSIDKLYATSNVILKKGEDLTQLKRRFEGIFKFGKGARDWTFKSAIKKLCKEEHVDIEKIDFTEKKRVQVYPMDGNRPVSEESSSDDEVE